MFGLLNGGLELGLMAVVGGSVAWHVEYDKHPAAILEARFPGVPNYGDVTTTDWSQVEPVDWLTAGYPCQPFSHAGKRKGSADERHLWPFVADAVGALRPGRVLLENVAGHVSLGLDAVLWDLAALGYDATWGVVRAADAGAPHGRARIFIVAADTRRRSVWGRAQPGGVRGAAATGQGEGDQRQRDGNAARREGAATSTDTRSRSGEPQRTRSEPWDGDASAPADTDSLGREQGGSARHGWGGPADAAAPDTDLTGPQGCEPAWGRHLPDWCSTADTAGDGRDEGRAEPAGLIGRPDAAVSCPGTHGLCKAAMAGGGRCDSWCPLTDTDRDGRTRLTGLPAERGAIHGDSRGDADGCGAVVEWGAYGPAIARWEAVTGRPAPRPTEPGRTGERLSPRFVEWMQGLPDGWVTDVPIPRNAQLKALGNGVVPQQCALAVRTLLSLESVAA